MRNKLPKVKAFLDKANYEKDLFVKTRRFTNLSQACEKVWVAFTLFLEYKGGVELHGGDGIRLVAYRLGFGELYKTCNYLHVLHYEGSPAMVFDDVLFFIDEGIKGIRSEL